MLEHILLAAFMDGVPLWGLFAFVRWLTARPAPAR